MINPSLVLGLSIWVCEIVLIYLKILIPRFIVSVLSIISIWFAIQKRINKTGSLKMNELDKIATCLTRSHRNPKLVCSKRDHDEYFPKTTSILSITVDSFDLLIDRTSKPSPLSLLKYLGFCQSIE